MSECIYVDSVLLNNILTYMNSLYYMNKTICYQFFSAVHDKFGPVSKRRY